MMFLDRLLIWSVKYAKAYIGFLVEKEIHM
jgi:hypothetical protein